LHAQINRAGGSHFAKSISRSVLIWPSLLIPLARKYYR
jgi:hypothetical protein